MAAASGKCNAKTKRGGKCTLPAGWGTDHAGYGACKFHFGATPNGAKHAAEIRASEYVGKREISPLEAIDEQLQLAAGAELEIRQAVAALPSLVVTRRGRKSLAFEALALREASRRVVDVAEVAHRCGVEERRIGVLEQWAEPGAMLLEALKQAVWDRLDAEGRRVFEETARTQLYALEGGKG